MRHQLHPQWHLHSDDVRSGLIGLSYKDCQPGFRRERGEWLPFDAFRQDGLEISVVQAREFVPLQRSFWLTSAAGSLGAETILLQDYVVELIWIIAPSLPSGP